MVNFKKVEVVRIPTKITFNTKDGGKLIVNAIKIIRKPSKKAKNKKVLNTKSSSKNDINEFV